jgi:uncharacterized membrane protein
MQGGRVFGAIIILVTLLTLVFGIQYNRHLEQEREQAIAQLTSTPQYQNCKYDASTCPQAQSVSFPTSSSIGLVIIGILLGIYLIRSDITQRGILKELEGKREQLGREERKEIIMSVLTQDERRVVNAVIEQPGITQATLRLRTDMSKAKLSMVLKELEGRGIIRKIEDGKTNTVHLKREI